MSPRSELLMIVGLVDRDICLHLLKGLGKECWLGFQDDLETLGQARIRFTNYIEILCTRLNVLLMIIDFDATDRLNRAEDFPPVNAAVEIDFERTLARRVVRFPARKLRKLVDTQKKRLEAETDELQLKTVLDQIDNIRGFLERDRAAGTRAAALWETGAYLHRPPERLEDFLE